MKPASLLLAMILGYGSICLKPASAQLDAGGGSQSPGIVRKQQSALSAPVLIAKGRNFFLHSFDASLFSHKVIPYDFVPYAYSTTSDPGVTIAHTALDSGKISWLYQSGTSFDRSRGGPGNITRLVLGLTWDDEHIYVCVWRSGASFGNHTVGNAALAALMDEAATAVSTNGFKAQNKRVTGRNAKKPSEPVPGALFLIVFRTEDGSALMERILQPPKAASQLLTKDSLTAGPLILSQNGVICFNEFFVFEGERLVRHSQLTQAPQVPVR
jgi:hypothetical protein